METQKLDFVIGPDGEKLWLTNLPKPDTTRWVVRRKAEVVLAVKGALLTVEDACRRYNLSIEEFLNWQRLIDRHGLNGLRVTKTQLYRSGEGVGMRAPSVHNGLRK